MTIYVPRKKDRECRFKNGTFFFYFLFNCVFGCPLFSFSVMSSFYIRLPEKYKNKSVQEYLDDLLEFYNEYFWLIHVLPFNFITHRQWDQFDVEWRNALMSFMEQAGDNWAKALLESILNTNDYVKCKTMCSCQ